MTKNTFTRKEFIETELDSNRFVGVKKELPVKEGALMEDDNDYIITIDVDSDDPVAVKKQREDIRLQNKGYLFQIQKPNEEVVLGYSAQENEEFVAKIEEKIKKAIRSENTKKSKSAPSV